MGVFAQGSQDCGVIPVEGLGSFLANFIAASEMFC